MHSLEHGRIEFQYKPGTLGGDIAKLRALAEEPLNGSAGYHVLFFENDTKMPANFAATAWTKSLTCPQLTDAVARGDARVPQGVTRTRAPSSFRDRSRRALRSQGRGALRVRGEEAVAPAGTLSRIDYATLSRRLPERLD